MEYVWDAENRLIEVRPTDDTEVDGNQKVEFAYDYIGRRVQKKVWTYDGQQWNLTDRRKFVWSGWLMLLELDGNNDVIRKYTWGLDLAGQNGSVAAGLRTGRHAGLGGPALQDAGGIGGLLAVHDAGESQDYLYLYDANGNVGQVLDWDAATVQDAVVTHYEYDPYGNVTASAGDYADENPIRFSTKYWDDETDLYYFGYRYYSAGLGRWISRDPIGEWGGKNLYAYLRNALGTRVDPRGLFALLTDEAPQGRCKMAPPRFYLPPEQRRWADWGENVNFFLRYWYGHLVTRRHVEFSHSEGAGCHGHARVAVIARAT